MIGAEGLLGSAREIRSSWTGRINADATGNVVCACGTRHDEGSRPSALMGMLAVPLAFAALVLLPIYGAPQQELHDWLIIPNVRIGPITASSTEASLREAFGEKSIITERVFGDVETNRQVTLIYRGDPTRAVAVSWRNNRKPDHPETISFCFGFYQAPGIWRTKSGIGCGTSLLQLEALNGRPFTLAGYGRDLSGTVTSWVGGKLEEELGPKGALQISVAPEDQDWREKLTAAEREALERDNIRSNDPVIQRLNPVVYSMVFRFLEGKSKREPGIR